MPRLDVSKVDVLVLLLVANSLSPVASSLPALPALLLPQLPRRRPIPYERRVKGREAIACDAAGALDLVAATGTLTSRGRWAPLSLVSVMSICRSDLWMLTSSPGPPYRVGPPGPQPGAADRQVANTLAELIIGGALVSTEITDEDHDGGDEAA